MHRQLLLWGSLAGLLLVCERWLTSCLGATPCLGGTASPREWLTMGLGAGSLLLGGVGLAAAVRSVWLIMAFGWEARRLHQAECPAALTGLARELGISRLHLLAAEESVAFCAGVFRPAVYLSVGVYGRLDQAQLEAVLLHELDHAVRREPVRRAVWRALREVAFFLPVLEWVLERRIERSELVADRRAIERLGPRPVAGALWVLGTDLAAPDYAAFTGAAQPRAAQLLGDPIPRCLPRPSLLVASVLGAVFAIATVACAMEIPLLGPI
ncbi:MAG: hypothetical protein DLM67_13380 [Candidatus Nephthysia bennettiae]|nr:MAG: hypothetical protein DLM67_13380 [Candidatus Dormibacteraeota bacterium]